MAAFNKIEDFVEQLALAKHQCNTDQFSVALTNSAPVASNTILANITQIANANGYTTGGIDTLNTLAESPAGTATCTGTKSVWTCVTAPMGPFRYVVLFNETQTSPVDPLIGWWDYGSALTLQIGETFSVKYNSSDTTGTIFTIT